MVTIRWAAFIILGFTSAALWSGARSWLLAGLMAACVLVIFWSFGAFRRDVWFGSPEEDAEYARIDAEIRAHEVRMNAIAEERGYTRT